MLPRSVMVHGGGDSEEMHIRNEFLKLGVVIILGIIGLYIITISIMKAE